MGFFKTFFATLMAIFVSVFLLFLFVLIVVISSQRETEPYVRNGTVLEIKIGNTLAERETDDPLSILLRDPSRKPVTLRGMENNLEKAAADDRIEGVWIKVNNVAASWSTLTALRDKMEAFRKESGKFIYISTDDIGFNEQSYFLATAADSIFSPPETFFEFDGFFIQSAFFKEFLDKMGVEAQIFRAGTYKSAVEPFNRTDFSEESKEQLQSIVDNVAHYFLIAVGERSGKTRNELDQILNEAPMLTSRDAYEAGFIDALIYPDEMETRLENRIKELGHDELRTITYQRYNRVSRSSAGLKDPSGDNKIAVINATGNIMPELGTPSPFSRPSDQITARNMSEHLKAAREDDDIKAIVVRITSPGGAGSTSDLIWEDIRRTAEEKPVIASFGSVAASGGYYIGMAADTIVASTQTITGSIGVFGLVLNMQELLNEKLGVRFDAVTTHEQSLWITPDRPLSEAGKQTFQQFIDDFYEIFLERVATSRGMSVDEVHTVAQGRVWTGPEAIEAGLVDALGELDVALAIAAEKADIEEYTIESFPKPKSLLEMFTSSAQTQIKSWMNPGIKELEYLDPVLDILVHDRNAAIARIPFDFVIH